MARPGPVLGRMLRLPVHPYDVGGARLFGPDANRRRNALAGGSVVVRIVGSPER